MIGVFRFKLYPDDIPAGRMDMGVYTYAHS